MPRRKSIGKSIRAAGERIRQRVIGQMRDAAGDAVKAAEAHTPGDDLPKGWSASESGGGRGRDSRGRFVKGGVPFKIRVKNDDKRMHKPISLSGGGETTLARIVEYGSRAHRIEAKPGGVLVFNIGGRTIYTKSVNHPGTPAYRPHARAREAAEKKLRKLRSR